LTVKFFTKYCLVIALLLFTLCSWGQKVTKSIVLDSNYMRLDSLSIIPSSFEIYNQNKLVSDSLYELDFASSTLYWKGSLPVSLRVNYSLFHVDFSANYSKKDTSLIQPVVDFSNPFRSNGNTKQEVDIFGLDNLNKSGSISRGLSVGNAQDLGVNSNFNLQLSGKIGGGISILASVTDDNIPIQPNGNTQQLQDFDKVFI